MKTFRKPEICLLILLIFAALVTLPGCGKKGPPTMRSFAKPDQIKQIRAIHRDGKINFSWSYDLKQSHITIKGFRIYRAEGKGAYAEISRLPADARRYSDASVKMDTQYLYKIRAYSARDIDSDDSAEISARPVSAPDAPSGLTYRITNNDVGVAWEKAPEGVSFNIYRREGNGVYPAAPLNEKPLDKPFFRDNLNLKTSVTYVVVAVRQTDIANESGLSEELRIDPQTFAPAPPVDVRYVRSGNRGYLTWKDNDEAWVKAYRVYRRGPAGQFELLGEVNVPVYLDEDRVYENSAYRVTAVGPQKESLPSDEVIVRQSAE
jgi:predicted small lipoprotein YifL